MAATDYAAEPRPKESVAEHELKQIPTRSRLAVSELRGAEERNPLVSVIIPAHDRPAGIRRAVDSVLASTISAIEVIVVGDLSYEPASNQAADTRLRVLRTASNRGNAAARNAGVIAARSQWLAFCGPNDAWSPRHLEAALDAADRSTMPRPVATVSSLVVVGEHSAETLAKRHARPHPRGEHFFLEGGDGHRTMETLVVEREAFLSIGGFDESFHSAELADAFLRLNPVCSLEAVDEVTYELRPSVNRRPPTAPRYRLLSTERLMAVHRRTFDRHPTGAARYLTEQALTSLRQGDRDVACRLLVAALKRSPRAALTLIAQVLYRQMENLGARLSGKAVTPGRETVRLPQPVSPRCDSVPEADLHLLALEPLQWQSGYEQLLIALTHLRKRGIHARLSIETKSEDSMAADRLLYHIWDLELNDVVDLASTGADQNTVYDARVLPAVSAYELPKAGNRRWRHLVITDALDAGQFEAETPITIVARRNANELAEALSGIMRKRRSNADRRR